MKNDKLIPLTIEGVRVSQIAIEVRENNLPVVSVSTQMIMSNGDSLTSLQLSTNTWQDESKKLKIDVDVLDLIGKLERALITPIHRTLNAQQNILDHQEV